MAAVPDQLTVSRNRDLKGIEHRPFLRWALLTLLGLFVLSGLLNAFGQKPHTASAATDGVELQVYSPERLRSGLFFMSRFTIRAEEEIEAATLVLDPGWLEGITLNSLVPSPVGEANRDGKIALDLGRVPAGRSTSSSSTSRSTRPSSGGARRTWSCYDGETPLLHIDRTVTIFP